MGILGFIQLFKKASLFLLQCQEQVLTIQLNLFLNKNKKHLKNTMKGCSVNIEAAEIKKRDRLNNELKNILKKYKNDKDLILQHIKNHKTKVFKLKDAKKILAQIGEEQGLIPAHSGFKAFIFNLFIFKKIGFSTEPLFIIDSEDVDVYLLIQQFHKWYFMNNDIPGYDEKSQSLLIQINKGNEDSLIKTLKADDIIKLQQAIARDIESISFVEQYARETAGSKNALDKIINGQGAKI